MSETITRICLACGLETSDGTSTCPKDGTPLSSGVDPWLGTTFDSKYLITDVLGRGGMSSVYKARHLLMDRPVAIKFLRSELVHDNVMLQRFQLESKAVSLLKHPNIVTVHDFGLNSAGIPYLIMDFLEGQTMSDLLTVERQFTPERCVAMFAPICDALAHTHAKGVIHRDIKPSNLIVSKTDDGGEISRIVDFGIAKLLLTEGSAAHIAKLTATGEVFGSPAYMSPEQCNGAASDTRTDIYALGCVIYQGLTGSAPFLGKNAMETILKHVNEAPRLFSQVRPDLTIPPALEYIVLRALQKDPDHRFQSMSEFASELRKALTVQTSAPSTIVTAEFTQVEDLEHTRPVALAPNMVPEAGAGADSDARSKPPPLPAPAYDLGVDQKLVSKPKESANDRVDLQPAPNMTPDKSDSARARPSRNMPLDSMILPGSDLFGYETLAPAKPDAPIPAVEAAPQPVQPVPYQSYQTSPTPINCPEPQPLSTKPQVPPKSHLSLYIGVSIFAIAMLLLLLWSLFLR